MPNYVAPTEPACNCGKHLWQPISTAPRDGTPILGFEPFGDMAWSMAVIVPDGEDWGKHETYGPSDEMMWFAPTHWMPLPEAPV